jgi:hypothetical protein
MISTEIALISNQRRLRAHMRQTTLVLLLAIIGYHSSAQIINGQDTLVGNEWLEDGNIYHALEVWQDGVYQIQADHLTSLGISTSDLDQVNLYCRGEQLPVTYVRNTADDIVAVEFYGEKNRGQLDDQLYRYSSGNEPLNPRYSLYTDTAIYWITVDNEPTNTYVEASTAPNGLGQIPYLYLKNEIVYGDRYWKPVHGSDRDYIRYSNFDYSEGFGKAPTTKSTVNLAADNLFANSGLTATVNLRMGSNIGQQTHEQSIVWNGQVQEQLQYNGYEIHDLTYEIPANTIESDNELEIVSSITADLHILAYAELRYPATPDAAGASTFWFELDPFSDSRQVNIANWTGSDPVVYDLNSGESLQAVISGDRVLVGVPPRSTSHQYVLVDRSTTPALTISRSYQNDELVNTTTDYVILTNAALQGAAMDDYVTYRESNAGGNYNVEVVDVATVYDQFGFGVKEHGLAMKNFGHYLVTQRPNVKYLFIIGKGRSYDDYRTLEDRSEDGLEMMVPSYGAPSSDNLITALGDSPMARIPTGRLAINSGEALATYLDKIVTYEAAYQLDQTIEDKLWQKKILHLSGGSSNGTEQSTIANYLLDMEQKVEENSFGADVTTFYKTSSDDLQTSVSQSILDAINGGLRLLTFFGHSSQGSFDFSIEDPSKYENDGRTPVLLSLGCLSGDIHTRVGSLSEDFVLEPERGVIAFLAASGTAYLNQQGNFGNKLYDLMGGSMQTNTLSEILQEIARQDNTVRDFDFAIRTMLQQFTLHGDPAIRLMYNEGPDYLLDYASATTSPEIITTSGDIEFTVDVVNIGAYDATSDSIDLAFIHRLPNGSVSDTIYTKAAPVSSREQVSINVTNPGVNGVGKNTLTGRLDVNNTVAEIPAPDAEQNNRLRSTTGEEDYTFFILDNSIRPIYPANYSIVNSPDFEFAASTANVFQETETYLIEVDTTTTFDSPLKYSKTKTVSGGTVTWDIPLNWTSNTVYYWRVSPEASSTETGDLVWQSASFIYLPNSSEGWNQSHYYQWLENVPNGTMVIDENRDFQLKLEQNYVKIFNNTRRHLGSDFGPRFIGWTFTAYGSAWMWNRSSLREGIHVAVVQKNRDYWLNQVPGRAGSTITRGISVTHSFKTSTPEERLNLIRFLKDSIPDGDHALIYSGQYNPDNSYYVEDWESDQDVIGTTLFETFDDLGITGTRILKDRGNVPFIFMCEIGTGVVLRNVIAETVDDEIEAEWEFVRYGSEAIMKSPVIGPAQSWDKVLWNEDLTGLDSTVVVIKGGKSQQNISTVIDTARLEYEIDIANISVDEYPYLQLELLSYDSEMSAAQMNYWRVLYTGSGEGTICVDRFHADTLQQGEVLTLAHTVKNISSYDLDSLLIKYEIVNTENQSIVKTQRIAPLASGMSEAVTFNYNTTDISGNQILAVELNPDNDQVEAYTFNNVGLKRFFVKKDNRNPELDVLFDGVRIMHGDYVSAQPEIVITLEDDNPYILINDTSSIELRLNSIDDPSRSGPIYLDDPRVLFTPSTETSIPAELTFSPILEDGTYELVVQGRDAASNFSGNNNRSIEFKVDNQSRVSNVYNYPNPFSTSTQFIFMITGQDVPDDMAIQIMTVSGKVVREITKEELGPIQIGLNRSSYKWDGRDEFGSQLGNGVYLYRVMSSHRDEEEIQHFDTAADDLFKEGFGKMVIMR